MAGIYRVKIVYILSGVALAAITTMGNANSLDMTTRPSPSIPAPISVEFSGWMQATQAKQQLLPRILAECPHGFTIVGETYKPLSMGKIQLSINYTCVI
jgi:hypothetical protein